MRSAPLLITLLLALICGCAAPQKVALFGPAAQEVPRPDEFPQVLDKWTRSTKIYQGLENKLFVTATYHSPELRRAFPIAFPEIQGHGGEVTKRELVNLTADVERYHNFFVAAYTPERKWNDLAKPDSIWRLTLIGSNEVAVESEEIIAVKVDENLRAVYPYISRFDKTYLVRFPMVDPMGRMVIDAATEFFTLRIASALGVAELTWDLIPMTPAGSDALSLAQD